MEFIALVSVCIAAVSVVFALRGRKTTKVETLASLIAECEACAIAHAAATSAVQARMGKDTDELAALKTAIAKLKA